MTLKPKIVESFLVRKSREVSINKCNQQDIQLSEDEANELANELKEQILLGKIPKGESALIQVIVAGLADKRGLLRRTFSESLGLIGKAAVPALRNALLNHQNVTVRRAAAKTLKLTGDPSALPDLLQALISDPDPVVQCSSAGAMAIFGESAVDHLLTVFRKESSTSMQRGLASWGLSFVGAEAPEALRKAAESNHAEIRAAGIAALGEQIQLLGDDEAKNILCKALEDQSSEVRAEATSLLGKLNELSWTEDLLLQRLKDSNTEVRINAALSLMKLNAVNSIDALQQCEREEKNQDVLKIIRLSIMQIKSI